MWKNKTCKDCEYRISFHCLLTPNRQSVRDTYDKFFLTACSKWEENKDENCR